MEKPLKKSKGKGKATEKEQGADEVIFDENVAEEQEKITCGALYSVNLINLANPPLPMEQGPWNKRPIDTKSMRKLKDSFKSQGICAFNLDNALPLVLARDHLHPNALNNSVNDPETAPMLQLMDKGLQESALIFAGGHHQRELILQLWESNKKSLGAMETKLEKKKTTLQNKLDKRTTAPLQQLHQEIDDLEKKILTATRSTLWTVKVYDAGKSSILTHIYYLFTKAIFRHRAHK